ncbi:MAG: Sec-independent protein translocase subunit TatA/TatB [Solirubrobacteraceae bacterium]
MFGQVGTMEIVVVLVIALIVLGPKRLPEMARSLGRGIRELKDSISLDPADDDEEDDPITGEQRSSTRSLP